MIIIHVLGSFIFFYVLIKIGYFIRGRYRGKPKDVELRLALYTDAETGWHTISIIAPFYDEPGLFDIRLGLRGLEMGYTPIGLASTAISRALHDKYLLQMIVSDNPLPDISELSKMGLQISNYGIHYEDGIFIYSPQSLESGALNRGITKKHDFFLICPEMTEAQMNNLRQVARRLKGPQSTGGFYFAQELLNIEAIMSQHYEEWCISSPNDELLYDIADAVYDACYDRLFHLNQIQRPHSISLPGFTELLRKFEWGPEASYECQLYFEKGKLINFISPGKKYKVNVIELPRKPLIAGEMPLGKKLKWYLFPKFVKNRAYYRSSILRFSVQYFLLAVYCIFICMALMNLGEYLYGKASKILEIAAMAIGIPVPFAALIIAMAFLGEAVFSRRSMIRTGF